MISALVSLVIGLAILYCIYLLIEWVLGFIGIVPSVFTKIVYIIFVVIAFVLVLQFLGTFFGGSKRHLIECKCECGKVKQLDHVPFRNGTHSTKCGSCSRVDTCFTAKEFKSIYSHPLKMHSSEDEDIIHHFEDFSHRYYRDDNN